MAGYLVEIVRDVDSVITEENILHYISNNTAKPRGVESRYIDSEKFEFPEITSPLADEDGIIIENDNTAQGIKDGLVSEVENLIIDILAMDTSAFVIDGGDETDIKKLLRLVQLLLAQKLL